ncbi:MAG: PIG-L deacetylase family protein [Gemmatimonadota bacterium]
MTPANSSDSPGTDHSGRTLLVVLAHPDDEVGAAGTILKQRERGDRVVILWLTRGEMTEAFGPVPIEEVARRRERLGRQAGDMLDVETRFLDFPDTGLQASPDAAVRVARVYSRIRPDGILTWGESWVRGVRHPDHQATGQIARDAVTLARIAKIVDPEPPHRADCPVFTYRDLHSRLPKLTVDVEPYADRIFELAAFYRDAIGFGDRAWLEERLRRAGRAAGLRYAEAFDAWETGPGVVETLLPPRRGDALFHPDRDARR